MRVESKELRLGNWVKWGITPIQITEETAYRTYLKCKDGNVRGVHLTPEVIQKCGFGLVNGYYVVSHYDVNYCLKERIMSDDFILYIQYTDSPHIEDENKKYPISGVLKYLHQLQNLIYSLTGEELTYTP